MTDRLVIVPTYNEKENILLMIDAVMALDPAFDLLIIDDGSPDGTADLVRQAQARPEYADRVFMEEREGKLGLGTAYIHGFEWALARHYEYIFEMDCDFSHNPNDLPKLWRACNEGGGDLAVGSRYVQGVNVVNWPMGRVLMSYFASKYVRFITGLPVNDATAGFKCYTRKVLEALRHQKIHFVGYAFQIEMKFLAWKLGFNVVEVPIVFTDRTRGESKMDMKIFREAVFGVIRMKISSLFRSYHLPQPETANS
ncbi:MAG TPA: dolichyl-phosphate beta-D-mannosyltransferase [Cytophagales bacterium]|nr:dolichyl-phosphate beta-D-mannosyltransferase [Cytophagales bacterium]HAA17586.1 dolichyl-phosphate beta-D-mannosyltransferase [Cytophagales bacterium]HAP62515.1 dolichyl-phosphate beta-D-mannosyltransferase [Cytophagales bacterium]